MRSPVLKALAPFALAFSLAACTPAQPAASYDSTGGWVGTLCAAPTDCAAVGFVMQDSGGTRSALSGDMLYHDGTTVQYGGSLSGSRTGYSASWRVPGTSGYMDFNGSFRVSNNTFSGPATLRNTSTGQTLSATLTLEKTDDGLGAYSLGVKALQGESGLVTFIKHLR